MNGRIKSLAAPILIITIGMGWLLTNQNVVQGVNWIWLLGLAIVGVLILVVGGIDKVTLVVGPFLIASSFFSLLRQTDCMRVDTEVPSLVILLGALMLLVNLLPIPAPEWIVEQSKTDQ
jgi:hypothetical protein